MKRYLITLQAEQNLLITQEATTGNYRASGEAIPGRTWRGAYAIALKHSRAETFSRIFPDEGTGPAIRFGPLFPGGFGQDVHPLPLTAFSCKYHPGYKQARSSAHGVFDTLIRQYTFEVASRKDYPPPSSIDELRCPTCGAPGEPFSGFKAKPERTSTTHVAINRARHAAEDNLLYTREGMGAGQYFTGWVDVPDDFKKGDVETLFPCDMIMYVGANRSRGMGRARVVNITPHDIDHDLAGRVRQFNRKLLDALDFYARQTSAQYNEIAWAKQGCFFTVDLRSEAILHWNGLPVDEPPELSKFGVEVVKAWLEPISVGGWHAAACLPRHTRLAVEGIYLCRFTNEINLDHLRKLSAEGIGILREQGFGQLMICDPVHHEDEYIRW